MLAKTPETPETTGPRVPNPVDKHVGTRLRMRRMTLGISQEKLGDAIGLTFQQVQKYEKGTNRIGASRLHELARILQVPVGFFFEGLSAQGEPGDADATPSLIATDLFAELVGISDGVAVAAAFVRIRDPAIRRQVRGMIEIVAGQTDDGARGSAPGEPVPQLQAAE